MRTQTESALFWRFNFSFFPFLKYLMFVNGEAYEAWLSILVPRVAIEMTACRQAKERYDSMVMSGCCRVVYFMGLRHSISRYSIYKCIISFICNTKMGRWLSNCTHVQIHVSNVLLSLSCSCLFFELNWINSSRAEMTSLTHKASF